jgi:hypothetical protein
MNTTTVFPTTLFRLRTAAAEPLLLTREQGTETAARLRPKMFLPSTLVLDFGGIDAATPSFLDEICSEIDLGLRRHRDDNMLVVATHMEPEVSESFLYVLERHRHSLAYITITDKDVDLLNASPHLRETLKAAIQLGGEFTAPELADRLDLKPSALNQRLAELVAAGALGRQRDLRAERGKRFRYRAPSAELAELAP